MKSNEDMIKRCQEVYLEFGHASGMYCDWDNTKAVFLSNSPLPPFLETKGWMWENDRNASKYLGFYMSDQISPQLTATQVMSKLEKRLDRATWRNPSSLAARIIITNHLY